MNNDLANSFSGLFYPQVCGQPNEGSQTKWNSRSSLRASKGWLKGARRAGSKASFNGMNIHQMCQKIGQTATMFNSRYLAKKTESPPINFVQVNNNIFINSQPPDYSALTSPKNETCTRVGSVTFMNTGKPSREHSVERQLKRIEKTDHHYDTISNQRQLLENVSESCQTLRTSIFRKKNGATVEIDTATDTSQTLAKPEIYRIFVARQRDVANGQQGSKAKMAAISGQKSKQHSIERAVRSPPAVRPEDISVEAFKRFQTNCRKNCTNRRVNLSELSLGTAAAAELSRILF